MTPWVWTWALKDFALERSLKRWISCGSLADLLCKAKVEVCWGRRWFPQQVEGFTSKIPTLRFIMTFLPCMQFIRPTAAHQYLLFLLSMRDSKWLRWIFYPHRGHQKPGRMSPSCCGRKSVAAHTNICYPTAGAAAVAFLLYLLP